MSADRRQSRPAPTPALRRLNIQLRRLGVRQALLRRILATQILVTLAALALGLFLWPITTWIFWFGIGAALSVGNFLSLTKIVPQFMLSQYTSSVGVALFVRSQLRLFLVVGIGGVCAAWLNAPVGALLTGFSTILAVIIWGVLFSRGSSATRA